MNLAAITTFLFLLIPFVSGATAAVAASRDFTSDIADRSSTPTTDLRLASDWGAGSSASTEEAVLHTAPCNEPGQLEAASDDAAGSLAVCGPELSGAEPPDGSFSPGGGEWTSGEPDPYYEAVDAFDLFPADYDEDSLLQARLLIAAAMYIYTPQDLEGEFGPVFVDTMEEFGLQAKFVESPQTDTEAGVVWNDEIVIVTFRGTEFGSDFWTDIKQSMQQMPASWGVNVFVHDGFGDAWRSIRAIIIPEVRNLVADGRKLWITGHSLGGALASLAAYEFESVHEVAVEGVHTFGSPRVGNSRFAQYYRDVGLEDVTQRWVIEGDPVPTFFHDGSILRCGSFACKLVVWRFRHVGITNMIYQSGVNPNAEFELERHAEETWYFWNPAGALEQHLNYNRALEQLLGDEPDGTPMDVLPVVWM